MKKASSRKPRRPAPGEMRPEYRFDYRQAKVYRFAPLMRDKTVAVVLDPDVASIFQVTIHDPFSDWRFKP